MRPLLDTHVLLFWLGTGRRLAKKHAQIIRTADADKPLWLSDITLWEIATLYSLERITLNLPLRDWLERATAPPLIRRVPITPAVATEVALLPSHFHRDPADRIIVATARVIGASILTEDKRIIDADIVPTVS